MEVLVISVWKPKEKETTPAILSEWAADTHFILPRSLASILYRLFAVPLRSPRRFLIGLRLALSTSRPGIRGTAYQVFYFLEAILAAYHLRKHAIDHVHNHIGDQSGTVSMLAASLTGIGYSITFHGEGAIIAGPKYACILAIQHHRAKHRVIAANDWRPRCDCFKHC